MIERAREDAREIVQFIIKINNNINNKGSFLFNCLN